MGTRLLALAKPDPDFQILAAIERPDHPLQARDAGEIAGIGPIAIPITFDLKPTPQVLIDFSTPSATRHWLKTCRDRHIAMVIGTTGLQSADHAAIDQAAADIPILQAPNMSMGVCVLLNIAAHVARMLGPDYDIEILEAHHRFKKDAPSGTALALADAILNATGRTRDDLLMSRHGQDVPRRPGDIALHALRMGDEVGRHTAYFAALGERLELTHVATNRDTFARGALRAAAWLPARPPSRYTIADVLGIS
jgi:4-hydroxy-tetrahydrodipicolinate reductase